MNVFILICIGAINVMSIIGLYRNLKSLNSKKRLAFIALGFGGMYLIVSLLYFLSTLGFDQQNALVKAKQYITFTFVPINASFTLLFLAKSYMKALEKKITKEKFQKNCIRIAIFFVILLVVEFFYFRSVNQSMIQMALNH